MWLRVSSHGASVCFIIGAVGAVLLPVHADGPVLVPQLPLGTAPLAFTPDGRWLVAGGSGLSVWDVGTGLLAAVTPIDEGLVRSLQVSHRSVAVQYGSDDPDFRYWMYRTLPELSPDRRACPTLAAGASADGRWLWIQPAARDEADRFRPGQLERIPSRLLEMPSRRLRRSFRLPAGLAEGYEGKLDADVLARWHFVVSNDGEQLLGLPTVVMEQGEAILMSCSGGAGRARIVARYAIPETARVLAGGFDGEGRAVVVLGPIESPKGAVVIRRLATAERTVAKGPAGWQPLAGCLDSQGTRLAVAFGGAMVGVCVFDVASGQLLQKLSCDAAPPPDEEQPVGVAISADGTKLALGCDRVRVYDLSSGAELWRSLGPVELPWNQRDGGGSLCWLCFSPDRRYLFAPWLRFDLQAIEAAAPLLVERMCADRRHGLGKVEDGWRVWDMQSGELVAMYDACGADYCAGAAVLVRRSGDIVFVQGGRSSRLGKLEVVASAAPLAALSPALDLAAVVELRSKLVVFRLGSRERVVELDLEEPWLDGNELERMFFSPDGKWLVLEPKRGGASVLICSTATWKVRHLDTFIASFTDPPVKLCSTDGERVLIHGLPALEDVCSLDVPLAWYTFEYWYAGDGAVGISGDGAMVAASWPQGVCIADVGAGRAVAFVVARYPQGHLAFTPEGYYSCTNAALGAWRVGEKMYRLEKFAGRYHRPDAVRAALSAGAGRG